MARLQSFPVSAQFSVFAAQSRVLCSLEADREKNAFDTLGP